MAVAGLQSALAATPRAQQTSSPADDLQRAQAELFRAQAEDVKTKNRLLDALPAIAAGFAAWVALMQFLTNFASGVQQHRDTQLDKTLKRLGGDNPTLRATAAGTLGVLAQSNRTQVDFISEQLLTALALEENEDVMDALERAIESCMRAPWTSFLFAPWAVVDVWRHRRTAQRVLARARTRSFWRWYLPFKDVLTDARFKDLDWSGVSRHVDGFSVPSSAWSKLGLAEPTARIAVPRSIDSLTADDHRDFMQTAHEARLAKQRYDHLMNTLRGIDRYELPPAEIPEASTA